MLLESLERQLATFRVPHQHKRHSLGIAFLEEEEEEEVVVVVEEEEEEQQEGGFKSVIGLLQHAPALYPLVFLPLPIAAVPAPTLS